MILVERWVKCEGCGHREQADEHPSSWLRLTLDGKDRFYCAAPCVLNAIAGNPEARTKPKPQLPAGLQPLDVQMLELVAVGMQNREIAERLGFAESTVKNRMTVVYSKLGVYDRTQAILAAHAHGILNLHLLATQFRPAKSLF